LGIIQHNQIGKGNIPEVEDATSKELILHKKLNVIRNDYGKYGYLDKHGNIAIDYIYDGAYDFSEGTARVYLTINNRDLYGFIDENGTVIVSLIYEYALCFSEGLAGVRLNNKFGYVDKLNKRVVDIQFDDVNSFNNGKAKVKKNSEYFYLNLKGEII